MILSRIKWLKSLGDILIQSLKTQIKKLIIVNKNA